MAVSISGSNSISGLSGNDTNFDKVLEQLKQIESTQLRRLESWKSDWNLRYEAFGEIIDQVQAASNMLSSLANKNNFVTKNVTSSNENIVTAVANASAQDVQHAINVTQVASNAIWANTGHTFASKDDMINTSGTAQEFKYTYAGKEYSVNIPNKTTLDSFVNLVNNDVNNPGVKVSLIQTGSGYVFQVAGKDTGAANDLIIHNTKLVGMDATGTRSTWVTNNALNLSEQLTDPTQYVFDLVLENGTKKSITVSGTATASDLETAIEGAFGSGVVDVVINTDGSMTIDGVKSFTRRTSEQGVYTPASTWVGVASKEKLTEALNVTGGFAAGMDEGATLSFTVTMDDDSIRTFTIQAGATGQQLLTQLAQATQTGNSAVIGLNNGGSWGLSLSGVKAVECTTTGITASALHIDTKYASGVAEDFDAKLYSATTTLTFDDKLVQDNKRIDGKADGEAAEDLVFTVIGKDGTATNYTISGNITVSQFMQKMTDTVDNGGWGLATADPDNSNALSFADVKEIRLTTGSTSSDLYTSSLDAAISITTTATADDSTYNPENHLFYKDINGLSLEKAPDLTYTITLNDGSKGTLTLPSGKTMENVVTSLQAAAAGTADPNGGTWEWENKDGVTISQPTGWGVILTDADGNQYMTEDGQKALTLQEIKDEGLPIYLGLTNVQSAGGVSMQGQMASSDNWSIQRAANARYQIDNWPLEMESDTNQVSDVIEGVIFSIQDVGAGRISVSTDVTSVEQSIQNFLDAINSVLLTINELTAYDEDKEVTSNDPNDIGNDNYSSSGLTNQKGGLLMGNYGVQLLKSRFTSLLTSSPAGFQSRTTAEDVLSGDVLATLANLGIKMDNTTTSDTYGLFVIAPDSGIAELKNMDAENYNNMITNNLEAVVDFFCASGSGSSSTSDFRYGSHVEGITKAGIYDVEYTVDANGNIEKVTVGGVEATRDTSQPGYYYSVASGDARGLSILIDDLEPGSHTGQVRIKEGLVQTVNSFLKAELNYTDVNVPVNGSPQEYADAVALKSKNGALMVLRENYRNIMENIDAKIEKEQYRISVWESRQKQIFANLETLLSQYGEQQKTLESQLAQLDSGK